MNKLLQRQLQKYYGSTDEAPEKLIALLAIISESYDHYEKDRKMMERSIEISSNEMIELNTSLKYEKEDVKKVHKELKTLFEDIDEAFYSIDMNTYKLTQMSAACEKIYGYSTAEFIADGFLWNTIIHPDDKHTRHEQFKVIRTGKQVLAQYRIIHKDGSVRWIENKIRPTVNETGWLVRIDGVTRDISERKQTESELERSFSILEATIESTADGILVGDLNGRIVRFNKMFVELWGIPQQILDFQDDEKAIAFVLDQLKNPDEFLSKIKELYDHPEGESYDILNFKDGRTFERYSQPQLINGNCVGRVWSFRDITQRESAEKTLRKSEADLELKNHQLELKNTELERFAYVASHDLQEPLRTISSFVELLQNQYKGKLDETADQYFLFMQQTADRMRVLINALLEHSRIGARKELQQVDTNIMLQEVLADIGVAISEAGAEISVGSLPVISGYPTEIKQLFQNLIINAIKFRKKDTPSQIHISSIAENDYWKFSVSDNGIGIEAKHHDKIFAIFQRLHSRKDYEGSGIGLSNCKKIVDLHHGKIWVESSSGNGSTFLFTLLARQGTLLNNN
jgi:PAS domain S-box-containing protein